MKTNQCLVDPPAATLDLCHSIACYIWNSLSSEFRGHQSPGADPGHLTVTVRPRGRPLHRRARSPLAAAGEREKEREAGNPEIREGVTKITTINSQTRNSLWSSLPGLVQ